LRGHNAQADRLLTDDGRLGCVAGRWQIIPSPGRHWSKRLLIASPQCGAINRLVPQGFAESEAITKGGLFTRSSASLIQLRQYTDVLVASLDERQSVFTNRIAKRPAALRAIRQRSEELTAQFNKVDFFLGKHLTDKRGALFPVEEACVPLRSVC
jgi:hypothetical protein